MDEPKLLGTLYDSPDRQHQVMIYPEGTWNVTSPHGNAEGQTGPRLLTVLNDIKEAESKAMLAGSKASRRGPPEPSTKYHLSANYDDSNAEFYDPRGKVFGESPSTKHGMTPAVAANIAAKNKQRGRTFVLEDTSGQHAWKFSAGRWIRMPNWNK